MPTAQDTTRLSSLFCRAPTLRLNVREASRLQWTYKPSWFLIIPLNWSLVWLLRLCRLDLHVTWPLHARTGTATGQAGCMPIAAATGVCAASNAVRSSSWCVGRPNVSNKLHPILTVRARKRWHGYTATTIKLPCENDSMWRWQAHQKNQESSRIDKWQNLPYRNATPGQDPSAKRTENSSCRKDKCNGCPAATQSPGHLPSIGEHTGIFWCPISLLFPPNRENPRFSTKPGCGDIEFWKEGQLETIML